MHATGALIVDNLARIVEPYRFWFPKHILKVNSFLGKKNKHKQWTFPGTRLQLTNKTWNLTSTILTTVLCLIEVQKIPYQQFLLAIKGKLPCVSPIQVGHLDMVWNFGYSLTYGDST